APDADKVSRAIRQSHPQLHSNMRGHTFRDLDERTMAAHQIQACLEPSCAWAGTTRQTLPERGPWNVLPGGVPRALDPNTCAVVCRGRSSHYHAPSGEGYPNAPANTLSCCRPQARTRETRKATDSKGLSVGGFPSLQAAGHPTVPVLRQPWSNLMSIPASGLR
ncbi:hypothetical protein HPB47_018754, partial [Ixodes persulcatus]